VGVYSGPDTSESGLIVAFDAANRKCFANSVINSTSWGLGSGGATGYNQNGATAENERVTATDPFGKSSTVWETRPQGNTADDGGWNSDWFNIDNTKLYRFSVWVKRTSTTTGGTFYLGLYGNSSGIRRTDNSAYEGNPYWECSGTSRFNQDTWYLVVGHCYPYNTTYTGQHPETGIYTTSGGITKVMSINGCNIGADVKWAGSDVSLAIHRCYHYYCGDNTTRLQLFDPRIDAIDGTEPSIASLLSGATASRLTNYNNDSVVGRLVNSPVYNSFSGGSIFFDGIDDYVNCGAVSGSFSSFTIITWFYPTAVANYNNVLDCNSGYYSSGNVGPRLEMNSSGNLAWAYSNITGDNSQFYFHNVVSSGLMANTWHCAAITYNGGTSTSTTYYNGNETGLSRSAFGSPSGFAGTFNNLNIGRGFFNSRYFQGRISQTQMYNRVLTATEIQQNFNSLRGRFGL
jgi:hypothetical protein